MKYTDVLYARFAVSAIERYAIGIVNRGIDGRIATISTGRLTDRDHVRRVRNARKRERQQARHINSWLRRKLRRDGAGRAR